MNKLTLSIAMAALAAGFGAHAASVPTRLLGDVAPVAEATRHIDITPQTRYVNVKEDDVVSFTSNGRQFAVRFDGSPASFDLARLAPAGALDHTVTAYVGHNPETR